MDAKRGELRFGECENNKSCAMFEAHVSCLWDMFFTFFVQFVQFYK